CLCEQYSKMNPGCFVPAYCPSADLLWIEVFQKPCSKISSATPENCAGHAPPTTLHIQRPRQRLSPDCLPCAVSEPPRAVQPGNMYHTGLACSFQPRGP